MAHSEGISYGLRVARRRSCPNRTVIRCGNWSSRQVRACRVRPKKSVTSYLRYAQLIVLLGHACRLRRATPLPTRAQTSRLGYMLRAGAPSRCPEKSVGPIDCQDPEESRRDALVAAFGQAPNPGRRAWMKRSLPLCRREEEATATPSDAIAQSHWSVLPGKRARSPS